MQRRKFISLLGGAAAWPLGARAQQPVKLPTIGFLGTTTASAWQPWTAAFVQRLRELGWVEGGNVAIEYRWAEAHSERFPEIAAENVAIEYHWAENQMDRLPALAAELVRRKVAVIFAAGGLPAVFAAKAATTTIPILFSTPGDPVGLGLVTSLAKPGGNLTGTNFFSGELTAKRLELLREMVPQAARIAVLVNPANTSSTETTLRDVEPAARAIGLQIQVLNAPTSREINAAFASLVRERADALFVAPDAFFVSRRVQFVTLATRHGIPSAHTTREEVEAGGLMSYGPDSLDMYHRVGFYTGQILKGAKPADLPVLQSTKFEFVINLQTARALGIEVPNSLQLLADEVIE
jgi:ABC-type uncharacterized transport system substrate-binding protein